MNRSSLINYISILFIVFAAIFGLLYYFALAPDKLFYSIVPVTINKNTPPTFKFAFYGAGEHKLQKPIGVAIKGDNVYISDAKANKIWVYSQNGAYKYSFGRSGAGQGEFSFPYGIAVDSRNRVIVADMKNHRVQIFNAQGKFLSYFSSNEGQNTFSMPGGLAAINDRVYITDIWKNQIFVYDLDGRKLLEFGSEGTDNGQFRYPNGVTADTQGNIYVADSGNNRVQVFNKNGRFLRAFSGTSIDGVESKYSSPRGITVLNNDFLFVVSSMSSQIWTSDLKGQLYYRFGEKGDQDNQFDFPNGLATEKNRVYVTDGENHGVKVYVY